MNNIGYKEAAAFLMERNGFVVFTHGNPDGDTIGSAAALVRCLRSMGKNAVAVCPDDIPRKLCPLDKDGIFLHSIPDEIGTLVAVDVASSAMLGGFEQYFADKEFDLAIDHHRVNTLPCKKRLLKDNYIANGEIIYELMTELGVKADLAMAEALYTAICSDSGGFKYCNTRPETYEYAADFLRAGIDFAEINRRLFDQKTQTQIALEKEAYNSLHLYHGGKLAVVAIDREKAERIGATDSDFEVVNQIPRQILGVEVSAVIREREDCVKASLRSNEYFDVSELAKSYGGGGHVHAAGFKFNGNVYEVEEALVKKLDGVL